MKILIAEDDPVSRRILRITLERAGYDIVETEDGARAWKALQDPEAPRLAILDWMMPDLDGIDVCRRVRESETTRYVYMILLTAKGQKEDVVAGFDAGVDDYLTKPFNRDELLSRVRVGERIIHLESELANKVGELEEALAHVKQLQGLLPICMHCKKIRDDSASWHRLEAYIEDHSGAMFTHTLCEECLALHYPNLKGSRTEE